MNDFAKVCRSKGAQKAKYPNKDNARTKRPVHPLKDNTPASDSNSNSEGYLYSVRTNKTPSGGSSNSLQELI